MWFPAILVLVGAAFLLSNLGIITGVSWGIVWPSLLIIAGVAVFFRKGCHGCMGWHGCHGNCKDGKCENCKK